MVKRFQHPLIIGSALLGLSACAGEITQPAAYVAAAAALAVPTAATSDIAPMPVSVAKTCGHKPASTAVQQGPASWYDGGRNGPTASGIRFDAKKFTAASLTMPCGAEVEVSNLHNGHAVTVTITDSGPFAGGRILDVSRAAALALGMDGVAEVKVAFVHEAERPDGPAVTRGLAYSVK